MTQGILLGAEKLRAPIIIEISSRAIQHAGGAPFLQFVRDAAEQIKTPVALHFDHGESLKRIKEVADHFFSSVMIAYSISNTLEHNIKVTRAVVQWAAKKKISVQGEVGHISGPKDHWRTVAAWLTDPVAAAEFVHHTGVTSLAISVGNRHGIAAGSVQLDFERIDSIQDHVDVPLILHGGSGLRRNIYPKVIRSGIAAVNFDTDLRYAYATTLRHSFTLQRNLIDPRNALSLARQRVGKVVEDKIKICRAMGKA